MVQPHPHIAQCTYTHKYTHIFRSHLIKPSLLTIQSRLDANDVPTTIYNHIAQSRYVSCTQTGEFKTNVAPRYTFTHSIDQCSPSHARVCRKTSTICSRFQWLQNQGGKKHKPNTNHSPRYSWTIANKLIGRIYLHGSRATDIAIGGSHTYTHCSTIATQISQWLNKKTVERIARDRGKLVSESDIIVRKQN